MVQWLALLNRSDKVLGLILTVAFQCGDCMSSLYLLGFSPGTPASSHRQKTSKFVNCKLFVCVSVNVPVYPLCQPCDEMTTCPGRTLQTHVGFRASANISVG